MAGRSKVAERVQKYRSALREAGMRPIQIWVPDSRRRGFSAECRRQSLSLARDVNETEVLDWLAAVADHRGWR